MAPPRKKKATQPAEAATSETQEAGSPAEQPSPETSSSQGPSADSSESGDPPKSSGPVTDEDRAAIAAENAKLSTPVDLLANVPRPTVGRIVHYRLSEQDCAEIETNHKLDHVNSLRAGAVVAAMVVGAWDSHLCNLKLIMDGDVRKEPWFTSRPYSEDARGAWFWPPRV